MLGGLAGCRCGRPVRFHLTGIQSCVGVCNPANPIGSPESVALISYLRTLRIPCKWDFGVENRSGIYEPRLRMHVAQARMLARRLKAELRILAKKVLKQIFPLRFRKIYILLISLWHRAIR